MIPGSEKLSSFPTRKTRTNGYAIPQRFSQCTHIGNNVVVLESKKFPGSAYARLYFIQHHEQLMLVTQAAYPVKVISGGDIDATFSLNGFDQHSHNIFILPKRLLDCANIVIGHPH